jgi:putative phage-type endonuclease
MSMAKKSVMDDRRKYLGGTDAAAIMGASRWKSQLDVYLEKTADTPPDWKPNERMEFGIMAEQLVADLWMKRTGKKATKHAVTKTIYHPKYPFIGANVDRNVVGENAILECKTAEMTKTREWGENEIPVEYMYQVYHYMMVTGVEKVYLACAVGFGNFQTREVLYDKGILDKLLQREVEWWENHLVAGKMPENMLAMDTETLAELYPNAKPMSFLTFDNDEYRQMFEDLISMDSDSKTLELKIEQLKNKLKAVIKENDGIHVPVDSNRYYVATWKNQKMRGIDKQLELKDSKTFDMYNQAKIAIAEMEKKYPNMGRKFDFDLKEIKKGGK